MTTGEHLGTEREGVIRLTTPKMTGSATDAADRARTAVGRALGILYPSAVPLRDGRVRLTSRSDTLAAQIVRSLKHYLARRAADQVADDRLLAEAVAILGADVSRFREQDPARGATDALDRYLGGPGLDDSRRTEAEAMLRVALTSAAANDPAAAERLDRMSAPTRPPAPSAIASAAATISRDAEFLNSRTAPARGGRRRGAVGTRHRRASGRQLWTSQLRGTGLGLGKRPSTQPPLTDTHALGLLKSMDQVALAGSLTDRPDVDSQPQTAVVQLAATDVPQHIRVEIGRARLGALAHTTMGDATTGGPHVLHLASGLTDEQIRHVWTQQLSQLSQEVAAGQAERPRGVLGKLKAAFGHERRDRRVQADQAAFQVMLRDWHQARRETLVYGRPSGSRSVADLEVDLEALARNIGRRGGAEPALPWTDGTVVDPEAVAFGRAAERVAAAAHAAPNTPGHVRTQVINQIETLEASVADQDAKAATKRNSSRNTITEAERDEAAAGDEDQQRDRGAPERARQLRVAAKAARGKAARHTEIAAAYERAGSIGRHTLEQYRNLLTAIDQGAPAERVNELASTAKQHVRAYQRGLDRAMPVKDLLMTGVPDGKRLTLPVDDINRVLAANNLRQLPDRTLRPMAPAQYRRLLSRDGMVFAVSNNPDDDVSQLAQVRLRMKPRDVTELTDRDYEMSEQMSGTLGDGGTSVGTTATHSTSVNFGVNLQPILALATAATPLHAAGQLVAPRIDVTRARTLADSSGATAHYQSGWVDDNRAESLLFEWSGEWEIEVRSSPTEPWSPVETLDAGRQQTWVSSAYTVQAATTTVSLDDIGCGDQVTGDFPRHAVTSISGLQDATDGLVRQAQQKYGDLDRVAYTQIAGLMMNDSHRLLREMSQPGGLTRRIQSGGETKYELTWEVEPVWSEAELVGESSSEMWQEEVLVDFTGTNAGQVFGTSATATATVAFPGKPDAVHPFGAAVVLNDVGGSGVNLSPSVSAGRNVTRSGGQSVSVTTITPAVHRNQGPTQGVMVGLNVRATLRKIGDPKAQRIVQTGECHALLRVAENDLLRVGARADKNAVLREDDRSVKLDPQGKVLLRGDALPTTEQQKMPPWMGLGQNQLRGIGKALPRKLQGAEETRYRALAGLSKLGLVPPLDQNFHPRQDAKATDLQLRNYERVVQQISAPRIEAGINQACQGGLIVSLEDHSRFGMPRWRHFRLSVTQDHDPATDEFKAEGAGVTETENDVLLNISSRATGRTSGRTKALPLTAGIGGTRGPARGLAGLMGRLGVTGNRTALGKNFSQTGGRRVQRVALHESTEPLDLLDQRIRLRFAEITDRGDAKPLADVEGRMEIAYDSSMSRAGAPVYEAHPTAPHPDAVEAGLPVAVDAGNAADALCAAVPAIRADSTALPGLHSALSPASLTANREWMNGEYRLPFTVVRAPGNPVHMLKDRTILPQEYQIVVRGKAVGLTHVAMSQQNTVDINFTMSDVGSTSGTSSSGGFGGSAGGGEVNADGTGRSGGFSAGRTGGRAQSTTTSETAGDEQLLINPGTHHEFIERYEMTADIVHNGEVVGSIPLPDALAQKAMAERRALELYAQKKLDLPLWVVSDATERYLNDKLPISHRTAAGVLLRYQDEKTGVTTGLAGEHTAERMMAKLSERSQLAASDAPSEEDRFADLTQRVIDRADQRREVHTSEVYEESLGASQIESIRTGGRMLDLRELVAPQIDSLAPGLREASLQLQNDLDVDLDPRSYQGHLEDMLGAGAFEAPIEVPIQGQERPDVLFVQVQAQFVGPRTMENVPNKPDGKPDIPRQDVGGVKQNYDYQQVDRQTGHTVAVTGGIDGKGRIGAGAAGPGPGADASGGLSTDRTRIHTAGSGEQNTTLDRMGHFDLVQTHRQIVFTTQVVRIRNAGAAAQASARWKLGQIDPADITSVSKKHQVRADMIQWIPRGDLLDGPPPARNQPAPEQSIEHRPIQLPEGAVPLRAVLHGRGDRRRHELLANLTGYLEQPGVLGPHGVSEYRGLLHSNLKPAALKAKAGRLFNEGIDLRMMPKPGNGRSMIDVNVHATAVGWELHGPELDGQAGRVWRDQGSYRSSVTGNRLTPLTATGGLDGGLVNGGGTIGEQVKEMSSDANGTRLETSRFLEGQMVTVRIPVRYDATVRTTTDKGHGDPVVRKATELRGLANGEMFVRMLGHQYLEVLRQMENGVALDTALAEARLQATPEDFGTPDIVATEYQQGKNGAVFQPYRPLLDAIHQAKTERRTVVLLVQQADGSRQKYAAGENGTLRGEGDGGFGAAFGRLHPTVALMAEGRVDLRKLYNTSPPGVFNAQVAEALVQNGVPLDVMKGLDYTATSKAMAHAANHRARTHSGSAAGRTIAPTGHGPSLSGP